VIRDARGISVSHVAQFQGSECEVPSELDWKAAPALGPALGASPMTLPLTPALGASPMTLPLTPALGAGLMTVPLMPALGAGLMTVPSMPALSASPVTPPSMPALGAGLMTPPSRGPQVSLARTEPCPPESVVAGLPAARYVGFVVPAQRLVRRSALLVDATGRSASPARHLAGHHIVYDRLVGLVGFVSGGGHTSDRRSLIEAVECGWWYSAPLPNGRQVGAFMTDADLLPARRDERNAFWQRQLEQAIYMRERLGPNLTMPTLRICSACSVQLRPVSGKG
jgi:hypothetical protein